MGERATIEPENGPAPREFPFSRFQFDLVLNRRRPHEKRSANVQAWLPRFFANARSQAAVMALAVGGKEGGSDNLHQGADQWLLVIEGSRAAIVNGHKVALKPG
jgi:uncharacterized cupin superfamily protein